MTDDDGQLVPLLETNAPACLLGIRSLAARGRLPRYLVDDT